MSCRRAIQIDLAAFLVEPELPEWASFRDHYPTCPECAAAVAAWSRLEQGLRTPPPSRPESGGTAHPEPALLARYAEAPESLGAEAAALSAHLATCPTCTTELRALQRFDEGRLAERAPGRERHVRSLAERIAGWLGLESLGLLVPVAVGVAIVLGLGIWIGVRGPGVEQPSMPPTAGTAPVEERIPDTEAAEGVESVAPSIADTPERRGADRLAGEEPAPPSEALAEAAEPARPEVAVPSPQVGIEPGTEGEPEPGEILIAAVAALPPPEYALPPGAETLGWQRELRAVRSGGNVGVQVDVQAPDHVGQTANASPRLWWSLDAPTDHPLALTLSDDREIDPVLRVELPGPHARGLDSLGLASFGVELEPGIVYRWFVTVVVDPEQPARNPISGGAIERLAPGAARLEGLADVPAPQRGHELARRGLWYDAYDFFAELAGFHPELEALRRHRNALTGQAPAAD